MEKLVVFCALLCALLAVTVSGKSTDATQVAIDAPTPGNAVAGVGHKVPPGAHGRSKRAASCGIQTKLTSVQAQESVLAHNLFRGKETATNMVSMVWSDELAAVAQSWANTCKWEHGMLYDCSGDRMGQNLFVEASTGGYPALNITKVCEAWSAEKKDFNFATGQCAAGKMCGHYTQVAAARSREVGCAVAQCPTMIVSGVTWTNALFVVCDYRRPGNVVGEPVFIAGTPCSNCDSDATGSGYKCVNSKLCSKCTPSTDSTCKCGNPMFCDNGGAWSTSTCACVCPRGYYGSSCQYTCTCSDISPEDCAGWADLCNDAEYTDYMYENCKTTCNVTPCTLPPSCSA